MKIIDNFLDNYLFEVLQSTILGENFAWYYNDQIVKEGDGGFQFKNTLYNINPPYNGSRSPHFPLVEPCILLLGVQKLIRIKANLRPRTFFNRGSEYHTDFPHLEPHKTGIFYINTCNGYTKVKGHGKVKSVANRLLRFSSNIQHAGFTCTDEQSRVVVNFNYKPLSL